MSKTMRKIVSFVLLVSILACALPVYAVETELDATSEIPYISHDTSIADATFDGVIDTYYGQAGIDAEVPEGYSGHVIKLSPDTDGGHAGMCVDYSHQNIPIADIQSITFRIYIPAGGDSEFRIKNNKTADGWIIRAAPSSFSQWVDVTINSDANTYFQNNCNMLSLANDDGNLGAFCLIFRLKSIKCAYIDNITIKYKAGVSDDTTPPVISYNGPTTVSAYAGEKFSLDGISAYDNEDKASAKISYEWSDGALDTEGRLASGTHVCTVKATDRTGNSSAITITVNVKVDTSMIILDSVPYTNYISGVSIYDAQVRDLDFNAATAEGVPTGFKGNVLEVKGTSARFGMTFDPTEYGIPIGLIERVTFRFYFRESTNAIRFSNHGATDWTVLAAANANAWMEYSIQNDGKGFSNGHTFANLADANGKLGVFGIGTKYESEKNYTFYIDSVTIKLKENDNVAPVISYNGKTDILTSSGKVFAPGISAFDEQEGRDIALKYEWSDKALDNDGKMVEGEYTCTVSATDYYGNTSSLTLNVTVGPKDVNAPVIQFTAKEIHVAVGTYDRMVVKCVDDYDDIDVDVKWSNGAVDFGGRLKKGTHTLTMTATDLSGNSTVMVVTVYVTEADEVVGKLIECGK